MKQPEEKDSKKFLTKAGKYSTLGLGLLIPILLFALGGNWADHHFNNSIPWATLVGSLLGIGFGLYAIFTQLKD